LEKEPARRRLWPALVPLALLALGASLITPAGRHQWALSLFKQPTGYTALSFNEAWALPTLAVADKPIAISFSVGNHQGHAVSYRYVLAQESDGETQTLQQASKVVGAGATWTVSTSVRPSCAASPCKVQVTLPGHPETIDFLVGLTGGDPLAHGSHRSGSSSPRTAS
jgi:hypothetical protein